MADYGTSIEAVLASIKDGIELAVESLLENKQELPKDNIQEQFITAIQVSPHYQPVHA